MFLLVQQPMSGGKICERWVNLSTVATFGAADGTVAEQGYQTVLFTPNGYAMYSKLSPQEIIQAAELKVLP